MDSVQIKVVI